MKRITEPFGKAGLMVAVVALVAAMVGGAYAANHARHHKKSKVIITKLNQIKPNVQKQLQGKAGPAGPTGASGANGKDGAAGAQGPKGDTGATGAEGPEGPEGPEGSPWTAGGTLPAGETETGVWSLGHAVELEPGVMGAYATISYSIPLSETVTAHFVASGTTTECPGSWIEPKATAGNLCLYKRLALNANYTTVDQSKAGGTALFVLGSAATESLAYGSFAVTAPATP